jgi:hypothetical protein
MKEFSEHQQIVSGDRITRGLNVVGEFFGSSQQGFVIAGCKVEAVTSLIPKQLDLLVRQPFGLLKPILFTGYTMERQQPFDQKCVVIQVGVQFRLATAVGCQQAAFRSAKVLEQKSSRLLGGRDVARVVG